MRFARRAHAVYLVHLTVDRRHGGCGGAARLRRATRVLGGGDTVNLTQRLQQWAEPGETVLSGPTRQAIEWQPEADVLEPALVKGRDTAVGAHRFPPRPT